MAKASRNQICTGSCSTLIWEDDDLGVEEEIKDLRHAFERRYQFKVQEYKIPSKKPIKNVQQRIYSLLELDGKDTLLVVYYAGHARLGMQSNEGSIWFANRADPSVAVPSGGVQALLEESDADVLLLYDCCHSASAPTCHPRLANGGVTESIAACGFGDVAAEVDEHSFTKALIKTLVLASRQGPLSIGELHSRVLSQLKCSSPQLARDRDGNHTDFLEPQRRRTPIYTILSETRPRRSILLGPIPPPIGPFSIADGNSPSSSSPGSAKSTPSTCNSESPSKKRKTITNESEKCAQVLVIARVDQSNLKSGEWVNWIRDMPSNGIEVRIEGQWDSFSTLLLLRMPIAVWNLLPDNEAYDFVGFVTSSNMASLTADAPRCSCSCENNDYPTTSLQGPAYEKSNDSLVQHVIQLPSSNTKAQAGMAVRDSVSSSRNLENEMRKEELSPILNPDQLAALTLASIRSSPRSNEQDNTGLPVEHAPEASSTGRGTASNIAQFVSDSWKGVQKTNAPRGSWLLSQLGYVAEVKSLIRDAAAVGSAIAGSSATKVEQEQTIGPKIEEEGSKLPSRSTSWAKDFASPTPASKAPQDRQKQSPVAESVVKEGKENKTTKAKDRRSARSQRFIHSSSIVEGGEVGSGKGQISRYFWTWNCISFYLSDFSCD